MRRDEDPNLSQPRDGEEPEGPATDPGEQADDQEAMEPDLGSAG